MCGIFGILNLDKSPVSQSLLDNLTDILEHRGPDGRGTYIKNNIGLGHRRLSILDTSVSGAQPMHSEDDAAVITYNGEIYNFKEIRSELRDKGYSFNSNCDTEVILNSWIEWGKDCVSKFNGMFAFAIWDNNKKKLFLVRDRYGIKPLYYTKLNNVFIFSSEQKAIIKHPYFKKILDKSALIEYFTFQNIFTDKTFFDGINLLKPATIAEISLQDPNIKFETYWDYNFYENYQKISYNEYLEELEFLMKQAVKRQLISDVELGAYLSGGMDSGSITALASKDIENLKSFTCGFDLSSASGIELLFDERKNSEIMSSKFNTEHYQIVLKSGDMERCMNRLVHHIEEPRVGQSYPNYYVSKLASKFVKVVLSGIGGDELFAGYSWRYNKVKDASNYDDFIDKSYFLWQRLLSSSETKEVFSPILGEIKDIEPREIFRDVFKKGATSSMSTEDYINQTLYFENKTFLHGLFVIEDKISMSHGLETRVPFMDNDVVDFAMKCPIRYKFNFNNNNINIDENNLFEKKNADKSNHNSGKKILRESMQSYIPEAILNGRKQGFSAPDNSWFKGKSMEYVKRNLYNQEAFIYQYMDYKKINSMLNKHLSGEKNYRLLIWSLLNFEIFLNQNFL